MSHFIQIWAAFAAGQLVGIIAVLFFIGATRGRDKEIERYDNVIHLKARRQSKAAT